MNHRAVLPIGVILALVGALILGLGTVSADPPGNNGTVKIHEGATDEEPIVANEPHVCTFHVHFFYGDDVQAGAWWIVPWPPTVSHEDADPVLWGDYDATGGEDIEPDVGVFELPNGHYKLYWEGSMNPGGQVPVKHKTFWVECDEPTPTESPSPTEETPTPTATPTPTPTATPTPIATPTEGASPAEETPTPAPTVTAAPTPTPGEGTLPSTNLPLPGTELTVIGTLLLTMGAALSVAGLTGRRMR